MFSGLVQHLAPLISNTGRRLTVEAPRGKDKLGDSISINGVCLTVAKLESQSGTRFLTFDVSPETLKVTTLKKLKPGQSLNIERALAASEALGGHIVQGHVDGVGKAMKILTKSGGNKEIWFQAPASVKPYLVSKGSVTVNGVSLTVVKIKGGAFSVALIPFTLKHTNLGNLQAGDAVNLEADVIAKYIRKYTR